MSSPANMPPASAAAVQPEKTVLAKELEHTRPLTSCHFDPQGRFVFFGAEDNLVHRLDLGTGKIVSLAGHDSWIRGFASSPDGAWLYTGGYDGRLLYWKGAEESPAPTKKLEAHQGWVRAVAASPSGQWLATCGNDRLVKLWDASNGQFVREYPGHNSHVYNVIFTRDSKQIVSCDLKGTVKVAPVEAAEGKVLASVEKLHGYDTTFRADIGGARSIALRADGQQVALGGIMNVSNAFAGVGEVAVGLVNLTEGKLAQLLETKEKVRGTAWGIAHHPAGFWVGLSGGGGAGWLFFWKGDASHEFHKLKLKQDGRGMSLSPDGTRVAVAHADKFLRIYSLTGANS